MTMLRPECYQTPIVESLYDLQNIEHTFNLHAGFELKKNNLINAFREELLELQTALADSPVDSLALSSEVADNLIYIFSLANFFSFDFETSLIQIQGLDKNQFNFGGYLKTFAAGDACNSEQHLSLQQKSGQICQKSGTALVDYLSQPTVNNLILQKIAIEHFNHLLQLAQLYHLDVLKILSRKINRNFYKYANFKERVASGLDFVQARAATKSAWPPGEDENFLR